MGGGGGSFNKNSKRRWNSNDIHCVSYLYITVFVNNIYRVLKETLFINKDISFYSLSVPV